MIEHDDDGLWLALKETIARHHEDVFACLISGPGLMQWFPLDAEIDLRTGGSIRFIWDRDEKRSTTVAILEFDPGGRIVWDWQFSSSDRHAPVYWTVEPDVENGSTVYLRQGPFPDDAEILRDVVEEATSWQWLLCNLRSVLEAKHDMRIVRPI